MESTNELSFVEILVIQQSITTLSPGDIASIIEKPVAVVEEYLSRYLKLHTNVKPLIVKQRKAREKKVLVKAIKRQEPPVRIARRKVEDRMADRIVDMATMLQVKIDNRTTIFIRADQDPETERKKYLDRVALKHAPIANLKKEVNARYRAKKEQQQKEHELLQQKRKRQYPDYYAF